MEGPCDTSADPYVCHPGSQVQEPGFHPASAVKIHEVRGGGGLQLHVREWGGPAARSILFIHGWSQCQLFWSKQYESALADELRLVALDLRGHGMSEAPREAESYTDAHLWADDLAAIIDALDLERPVLVGHSYGGVVICDYLRVHGQGHVGAVDFVGAVTHLGPESADRFNGPGFLDHFEGLTADDLPTNLQAVRSFLRAMPAGPLTDDELETAIGWNMVVSPRIRGHLAARDVDSDDVLASLEVPLLVTHGEADTTVLPAMAEHVLEVCPTARASWYDGVGHLPNLEAPDRFNSELGDLARTVS